jgi:geranylgeranyl pyrophosphate synthase
MCVMNSPAKHRIVADQQRIEEVLSGLLPGESNSVAQAMQYAVFGEAQRLRPILAIRVARALGTDNSSVLRAAAAVELLHCASLVIDDLPCMDNSPMRRNRETVHIRFGESTAILASFGLVALAARAVVEHSCFQAKLLCTLTCDSLIGGQALDLELADRVRERQSSHVAGMKTVPLFVLAAEAGCLHSTAAPERKQTALDFAREFGISYQMLDDLLDDEIQEPAGVDRQFALTHERLASLGSQDPGLGELLDYLNAKILQNSRCHR